MKKIDVFAELAEIYNLPELKPDDMTIERFVEIYGRKKQGMTKDAVRMRLKAGVDSGILVSSMAYDTVKMKRVTIFTEVKKKSKK